MSSRVAPIHHHRASGGAFAPSRAQPAPLRDAGPDRARISPPTGRIPRERKPQLATHLPVTVRGWLQSYREGVRPRDALVECLLQARHASPAATWIHLASEADLERQLVALDRLVDGSESIDEILRRHPLYGVPFAVKDNIDVEGIATTAGCPAYSYRATRSAAA